MLCLFCESNGPYSTVEHIIPESLGNKQLLLRNQVCDSCQNYLGTKVEEYVLRRSPIGWWRVYAGISTKGGTPPRFFFRQPKKDKGILPDRHRRNDDELEFFISDVGEHRVSIDDPQVMEHVSDGTQNEFKLVLTPKMLHMMGRFLGKLGLEMLARDNHEIVRLTRFDSLRRFVRYGEPTGFLWPIFHLGSGGRPAAYPAEIAVFDTAGLIVGGDSYTLSCLTLGTEMWVLCLNDPYPHPIIRKSFPGKTLQLITY